MAAEFTQGTDAWIAHAVAGALSGAVWIGAAGLAFGVATVWLGVATPVPRVLAAASLLPALPQVWLLLRVAIDRRLFDALAAGRQDQPDLAGLDAALLELGWMPAQRAGRPLPDRARGALRLVRASAALTVCQLALALLTVILR